MTAIFGAAAFVAGLAFGWPVPYALASLAVVAVALDGRRMGLLAVVVACAVAGDLRGTDALDIVRPSGSEVGPYEGTILTYARRTEHRQNLQMETTTGLHLCIQTDLALRLGRGDVVQVDGVLRPLDVYAPTRRAALRALGCVGTIDGAGIDVLRQGDGFRRRLDDERQAIAGWFSATVPGDRGALLSGLVIGDDDALTFETRQQFYNLSMSHITAVSGSNLALLTWLLIGRGPRRRPILFDLGALAALWLYVFLAGAGPSTVRAGLTASLCVVVVRAGRRPELLTIACLVAAGQVALDPSLIGSLAYRLSTIAMLVMISTLTGRSTGGWWDKVRLLVACSVAIQLGTLPFTPSSDQAILAGVITNVLSAPLVGLAFTLGLVTAVVQPVSEPVASAVAIVAELPTALILGLIGLMDGSVVARWRLDGLGSLPRDIVRAVLLAGVALVFGRHARRGTRDIWARARAAEHMERWRWVGVGGGAAVGVVAVLLLR